MLERTDENGMIEKPDGSFIAYDKLSPEDQIEHDFVFAWCDRAEAMERDLATLKRSGIAEMVATRQMMFDDHGVKKGGKSGNLTLRSVCGRRMVKLTVSKHISFGKELEIAKALIFEVIENETESVGSPLIRAIVEDVFSLNTKGRIDTQGILNLRAEKYAKQVKDPRWMEAMGHIEKAILTDSATTYINFYRVDPQAKTRAEGEDRIKLDLAKV